MLMAVKSNLMDDGGYLWREALVERVVEGSAT